MSAQAALKPLPTMTVTEFLGWDGGGHIGKLELVDGIVRAMAPVTATQSIIQGNIVTAINSHLRSRKSPCRAGTEAPVIPPLAKRINARVPNVVVTCAPPSDSPTFDDPILIVEVLSPSNEAETWESICALAPLLSLVEILVVSSTVVEAQVFRRGADGGWAGEPEKLGRTEVVHLTSIDAEWPIEEFYRGTHLA